MKNTTDFIIKGNDINISLPFTKVDVEKRTVSGFATLDNVDKHGDVVDAAASMKAFSDFRGNLREMHQPIAAGRILNFEEREYHDPDANKTYKGIYVTAYVSPGAEPTWMKVLDKTLTGFSIGGKIHDKTEKFVKDDTGAGKLVRIIKDYSLVELSLVDNPANDFANILSIEKVGDHFEATGIAAETKTQDVYYCEPCGTAQFVASKTEAPACDEHGEMKNIGWVEDHEKIDKIAAADKLIEDFKSITKLTDPSSLDGRVSQIRQAYSEKYPQDASGPYAWVDTVYDTYIIVNEGDDYFRVPYTEVDNIITFGERTKVVPVITYSDKADTPTLTKGGATVAKEKEVDSSEILPDGVGQTTSDDTADGEDDGQSDSGVKSDEFDDTTKAAKVSEVDAPKPGADLDGLADTIVSKVADIVKATKSETEAALKATSDALEAFKKEVSGALKGIGERVDAVEGGTAVKKSADKADDDKVEKADEEVSFWRGRFLSVDDLVTSD